MQRSDARAVLTDAIRDLRGSWATLARADIGYKILAFAVLTPAALAVIRWVAFSDETRAIADTDIAMFFLTTPAGIATLVLGGAVVAGIAALEVACLMAIGFAAARGSRLSVRGALAFGAFRAWLVIRLTANMIVRLIAGLLPFAAAAGVTYWLLLRSHDINFYLSRRPPEFWAAAVIGGVLAVMLAGLLIRTLARWALALPLVLFENVLPLRALGESARRSTSHRKMIVLALAAWAIVAVAFQGARRPLCPNSSGAFWLPRSPYRWPCCSSSSQCSRSSGRSSVSWPRS
jgi:glycerophosphoryl diester phosphodiesterase